MRPDGCEAELLRRLAAMPFLDRLEMAAVSGRSRGAVYEAVERMERDGLVASIPPRRASHPPDQALLPHRRRTAPPGPRRGHDGRRAALAVPGIGAGAARPPGEARLPRRRLPACLRGLQRRVSPYASAGTAPCPWTPPSRSRTVGPPLVVRQGLHRRQDGLLQTPVAAHGRRSGQARS